MSAPTFTKPADATHEVIEMECAALVRWGMGDPSGGFLEIYAPDIVYFDPGLERRIDGLGTLTGYYEGIRGKVHFDRFELINPLLQVVGDAAILTFNQLRFVRRARRAVPLELHRGLPARGWKVGDHSEPLVIHHCQASLTVASAGEVELAAQQLAGVS